MTETNKKASSPSRSIIRAKINGKPTNRSARRLQQARRKTNLQTGRPTKLKRHLFQGMHWGISSRCRPQEADDQRRRERRGNGKEQRGHVRGARSLSDESRGNVGWA